MKTVCLLLFALLLTSFTKPNKLAVCSRSSKWIVSEHSSLIVNGSTNVNRFTCAIVQYPKTDTMNVSVDNSNKVLLSGLLNIAVKNFDCKNFLMTKQLRKTLKEDEFPVIQVRFLSLRENPVTIQRKASIKGVVELMIAGVTKRLEIDYQLAKDKNVLVFTGSHQIQFSDYNLQPPKRMGRIIEAKDELLVTFLLKMEAAP
jgi:hypothetical protein